MAQVNIHTAQHHFADLIHRAMNGEEIFIAEDNKPIVKITAVNPAIDKKRHIGTAKGDILISPDFDAPLKDFDDYLK